MFDDIFIIGLPQVAFEAAERGDEIELKVWLYSEAAFAVFADGLSRGELVKLPPGEVAKRTFRVIQWARAADMERQTKVMFEILFGAPGAIFYSLACTIPEPQGD